MIKQWYDRLPITHKLRLILTAGVLFALLFFSGIYTYYSVNVMRTNLVKGAQNSANLIGSSVVASIRFGDAEFAAKKLKNFELDKSYRGVCLYKETGALFAKYPSDQICEPAQVFKSGEQDETVVRKNGNLFVTKNIFAEGEIIGAVMILRSEDAINNYLYGQAQAVAIIATISLVFSGVVAHYLQKLVSKPIIRIAQQAQSISLGASFEQRLGFYSGDELGKVAHAFNNVITVMQERNDQIQARIEQLQSENKTLKQAQQLALIKLDEMVEEFLEPSESFVVYSQIMANKSMGSEIGSYSTYRADVLESLATYQVKISSFSRLTQLYFEALNQEKKSLNLKEYIGRYSKMLRQTFPYLSIEAHGQLDRHSGKVEILVYESPWEEIFRIIFSLISSIIGIIDFSAKLQFIMAPNTSELVIVFGEVSEKLSTHDSLLKLCELAPEIDDHLPYKKYSIEDPEAANEFVDEEVLQRQHIKFILDSLAYIGNVNRIDVKHSFEHHKFKLILGLDHISHSPTTPDYLKVC